MRHKISKFHLLSPSLYIFVCDYFWKKSHFSLIIFLKNRNKYSYRETNNPMNYLYYLILNLYSQVQLCSQEQAQASRPIGCLRLCQQGSAAFKIFDGSVFYLTCGIGWSKQSSLISDKARLRHCKPGTASSTKGTHQIKVFFSPRQSLRALLTSCAWRAIFLMWGKWVTSNESLAYAKNPCGLRVAAGCWQHAIGDRTHAP